MDQILQIGNEFILWLQGLGGWLTPIMQFFTFLGNEEFYLLIAPAIYWCLDAGLGLRLGLFLMANNSLKDVFKLLLNGPRPYWVEPQVKGLVAQSSFGVPSGHSQDAVVAWGTLAHHLRKGWGWAAAIALMLLIGISRMYLGVHFPHDVLLGWLIGICLLLTFMRLEKPVTTWFKTLKPGGQILASFLTALCMIFLGILAQMTLADFQLPAEWVANAAAAFPDEPPIAPQAISGIISSAGAFFGLAGGASWLATKGGFEVKGGWQTRLGRYLLGLVGVIVLWYGLGAVFPRGESLLPFVLRFLRYGLVGVWISAVAPFLFIRLRLASARQP